MQNQIWWIFVFCMTTVQCSFCQTQVQAQLPDDPATIFSQRALLFVDIPKFGMQLVKAKSNWYDSYYGESVNTARLRPLDFPTESRIATSSHWVLEFAKSIKQDENELVKELLRRADLFAGREEIENTDSDELVAAIANLLPGRVTVGIEPVEKSWALVIGVEYVPEKFDWHEELLAELVQSNAIPDIQNHLGVGIASLPTQFDFFANENVLYLVLGDDEKKTVSRDLIARIQEPDSKNLLKSRHFLRVASILDRDHASSSEIFCFLRFADLFSRMQDPLTGRQFSSFGDVAKLEKKISANTLGVKFIFGDESRFRYRLVYPIIQPIGKILMVRLASQKVAALGQWVRIRNLSHAETDAEQIATTCLAVPLDLPT